MATQTRLLIGFDRFVQRAWLDAALDAALAGEDPHILRPMIEDALTGKNAIAKTLNLLRNLWFRAYPETSHLQRTALRLARRLPSDQWLVLHWGMAMANFPFFHSVVRITGRLGRLQSRFSRPELKQRIQEQYSNQNTARRAADWVMQSLIQWHVVAMEDGWLHLVPAYFISDGETALWLLQVLLLDQPDRRAFWQDLLYAPELFPWSLPSDLRAQAHMHPAFYFNRTADGREEVALQP